MSQSFTPEEWQKVKEDLASLRELAIQKPLPKNAYVSQYPWDFTKRFGPWIITFANVEGQFVGTLSCVQVIGEDEVVLPSGIIAFAPREGFVPVKDWPQDIKSEANDLLSVVFGPLITEDSEIVVREGLHSLHWILRWPKKS